MKHSFQKIGAELFECNPFEKIGKDTFAITAQKGEQVNAMTAAWGGLGVMWGKNVVYVVVRDSRYTKEFMDAADGFSMTFFDKQDKNKMTLKYLGTVSGRQEDKIANANLIIDYEDQVPYIDDGNLVFICKKLYEMPMPAEGFIDESLDERWYADKDYHNLYVAEIQTILAR